MRRFTQGRGTREMTAAALQNPPPRLAYQRVLKTVGRATGPRACAPQPRRSVTSYRNRELRELFLSGLRRRLR